ncbi:MAG: NAD-dependent epimerase/dehydratase family protein [Candidatus Rokubacteria bacterium]|nr:NAD-dependent epimerase/dehydratase family protein [Candidatus Rokubacteria bacterium]
MAVAAAPVFVTGAAGFLGRRYVEIAAGRRPATPFRLLQHRRPLTDLPPNAVVATGDLEDRTSLATALAGVDTIVHFAGVTHADAAAAYLRVNRDGTAALVAAARAVGIRRFVLISSRAAHAACGDYGASKLAGEEVVTSGGVPWVVLRLAEVYGAGATEGLNALIGVVRRFPVVPYPAGPIRFAPLFLDDAVDAIDASTGAAAALGRTYTIAGPDTYGFSDLIAAIARGLGRRRVALPIPLGMLEATVRVASAFGHPLARGDQIARMTCAKDVDIEPARRDLGFVPASLDEGLRRAGLTPQIRPSTR